MLLEPAQGLGVDVKLKLGLEAERRLPEEAERIIRERFFGHRADDSALEIPLTAEGVE